MKNSSNSDTIIPGHSKISDTGLVVSTRIYKILPWILKNPPDSDTIIPGQSKKKSDTGLVVSTPIYKNTSMDIKEPTRF